MNSTQQGNATNNTLNEQIPANCKTLQFQDFVPWESSADLVDTHFESVSERVKVTLLPFFFLIGGPGNVINMAVFYKQGLRERINLCLFALSFADFVFLVECLFWNGEYIYRQFVPITRYGPVVEFFINHNLTGFLGVVWVSYVMSAIIASERCFCVISPLRSQSVLTTRTMAFVIVAVFVVVTSMYFVVVCRYRVVCVYDPGSGLTSKMMDGGDFYYRHEEFIKYLDSIVYGLGLPGVTSAVVAVTTAVTTYQLRKALTWRSESSSSRSALSSREVALTKMLIGNSILFIICISPNFPFRVSQLFIPELNAGRRYQNFFLSMLWYLEILSYINSSFNIIIYYSMGTKYRQTFKAIFSCSTRDKSANTVKENSNRNNE